MKTTTKQFEEYKKWVNYYIDKFNLDEWDIYFSLEEVPIEEFAGTTIKYFGRTANFRLAKELDDATLNGTTMKETARHEVCHLLISELDILIGAYVTNDEHKLANERLTVKLCHLLKGK